jgi:hypothetical protein
MDGGRIVRAQLRHMASAVWRQRYAGRKSWWALRHTHAADQGLGNAYFAKRGLIFLVDLHRNATRQIVAPTRRNWRYGVIRYTPPRNLGCCVVTVGDCASVIVAVSRLGPARSSLIGRHDCLARPLG